MKTRMKILTSVAVAVVVIMAGLTTFALVLGPTRGPHIQEYEHPEKALVVIDMQEDYIGTSAKAPFPYSNSAGLITTVNRLIARAQQMNYSVIYIRQEFDGLVGKTIANVFAGGTAIKGQPGTNIDPRVVLVSDAVFGKPKGDSFSNADFGNYLEKNRINELILCGLDGEFCVYHTAAGAINRGYAVTVITDGIAIRNEKKQSTMLNKFRKLGCVVKSSDEFMQ